MLRFLVRAHEVDDGGLDRVDFYTVDADVPRLEEMLLRGGRGPMGFNSWTLVGVELLPEKVAGDALRGEKGENDDTRK